MCTSYLAALQLDKCTDKSSHYDDIDSTSGDKLRISMQKGLIQLSEDLNTPIICVGPATSVTPMRSVIEECVDAGFNGTDLLCSISD